MKTECLRQKVLALVVRINIVGTRNAYTFAPCTDTTSLDKFSSD